VELCRELREEGSPALLLDGSGSGTKGWATGPLVAVEPEVQLTIPVDRAEEALTAVADLVRRRRAVGGPRETGLAVVLGYGLLHERSDRRPGDPAPALAVLRVDRSVAFRPARAGGGAILTTRECGAEEIEALRDRLSSPPSAVAPDPARATGPPVTSLPREAYLSAVRTLKRHITRGDIYQANLCQQFRLGCSGDELELYHELATRTPAPRCAFFDTGRVRLVSVSPETFLTLDAAGRIATYPIKGTRPRGATEAADREQRENLLRSPKDHAELLMIVDLERNDLGRVCRTGSVRVTDLAALRSFATVHHLVAAVEGRLRPGTDTEDLLRASFPGGSITGAPKLRAIELLAAIEPVRRGWFTGSLFWFGDDGTTDSSILIRSLVLRDGRAWLGAGGGIVADSDPEEEWCESNHKARALAEALGFDPEEAR
jgi:para-aminobenzoate synthetase component 1